MAILRNLTTGRTRLVEPNHIFGRAPGSSERISADYISAQHATLRWTGRHWVLRDLGSRNGTYMNGERVVVGEEQTVRIGTKFTFGRPGENAWELIDDGPPQAMAVPVDGSDPVVVTGELLVLPSADSPEATIYRALDATWQLERADAATAPIANLQTFQAGGRTWRFCCTEAVCDTALAPSEQELQVRHLELTFSVSRDEEFVSLRVTCGPRTFDMGTRKHNYLLLTLARHRMDDAAEGLPEESCGWTYHEEVATGVDDEVTALNLDVYRIRQQFGSLGVADAAHIIERLPRTRQLRIGTQHLNVIRL